MPFETVDNMCRIGSTAQECHLTVLAIIQAPNIISVPNVLGFRSLGFRVYGFLGFGSGAVSAKTW